MPKNRFTSLEKALAIFDRVLEESPADETELVWFQRRYRSVAHGDAAPSLPSQSEGGSGDDGGDVPRLTVLIRVVEGGRVGWHRTDSDHAPFLRNGLRQALALAKVQDKVKRLPLLPQETTPQDSTAQASGRERSPQEKAGPETELPLFDPELAGLDAERATELAASWLGDASGRLRFSETRVAVSNSHGLRRAARTTEIDLSVGTGSGPGAGFAAGSARRLQDLGAEKIVERARHRHGEGDAVVLPAGRLPVVLSPEAVLELLNVLNTFAFSGHAYLDGSSFLSKHRNVQVFDRTLHVRDDALRVPGMPFPFDLEGSTKAPVDLIVKGQPSTPALDRAQGSAVGLSPTAQSVGGQDAMFGNLFLLPGAASLDDLLQAADGGLWIGRLDTPECHDPQRLEIRASARGVRRIEGGRLGSPVPDLVWETSLLVALARLQGIGNQSVVRAMPTTPLGGIAAPALALADVDGFRAATPPGG